MYDQKQVWKLVAVTLDHPFTLFISIDNQISRFELTCMAEFPELSSQARNALALEFGKHLGRANRVAAEQKRQMLINDMMLEIIHSQKGLIDRQLA